MINSTKTIIAGIGHRNINLSEFERIKDQEELPDRLHYSSKPDHHSQRRFSNHAGRQRDRRYHPQKLR